MREDNIEPESEKMDTSPKGRETQGRIRKFYEKSIKPAFPEAITDLKILGGITALETRVRNESR